MRLTRLTRNIVSAAGATIALLSGLTIIILFVVSLLAGGENPYLGIVLYLVLPAVLIFGLVLLPAGMYWQARRERRLGAEEASRWPYLDLNRPRHRRATFIFLVGLLGFLAVSAVGSYQAYHFTESNRFCGEVCHGVMHPEFIAYQNSSHARVKCVECHIGSGADWYVKSKLSGAYQVYATLADEYPRPIPTPIENLRPAQETCEQCHWPRRFFGAQQRKFNHYMYDTENTHWPVNMLVKTGGGDPKTGQTAGIHWHMNIGVQVDYIPRDERRQDIPWVRITDLVTGRVTVYQDEEDPLSEAEVAAAAPRTMDCMDCHNRPSHKYPSPDALIDLALLTRQIDTALPEVKRIAVEAMTAEYRTDLEGEEGIANRMTAFFRAEYPEVYAELRAAVDAAIVSTQQAFRRSIFPVMNARWSDYPDDIGHFTYPGCMRCHDGGHVSTEGASITRECNACHSILAQGSGERAELAVTAEGLRFVHPEDIGEAWLDTGCYDCHTGVQP